MENDKRHTELTEIFKTAYSDLVAVLCQYYNIKSIQLAEDLVSDTFMQAMKSWSHKGIPDNPKAWLRKVAVNKLIDHTRKQQLHAQKLKTQHQNATIEYHSTTISDALIADSQLNMIFAVCHPELKIDAQICLALRLLCGLNIAEIASALLQNKETINKKLYRAKQALLKYKKDWNQLSKADYTQRYSHVLRIIYLLFNEGYYSNTNDKNIRQDICWEAMRLAILLTKQEFLLKKDTYALIALMCFHASRFNARVNSEGAYILYHDQDKTQWDQALIKKGELYLTAASQGSKTSKYHLEAAIAYWHTTDEVSKWQHILQLYNKLLTLEYSPIIALNRTYALAKANTVDEAIQEGLKLSLNDNHLYHCLMAELYKIKKDPSLETQYLNKALVHAKKSGDIVLIKNKLSNITNL